MSAAPLRRPRGPGVLPLAVLACALALTAACKRGEAPQPPASEGSGDDRMPTSRPTGGGETTGLVGTDVEVERVEIEDIGPPAPTVLITSGIKGYTEPCGCTIDLVLGGIDRVAGAARAMADMAPHALVLDAGNTLFEHEELEEQSRAQELRKSEVIAAALQRMGTAATVPGRTDFAAGAAFYQQTMRDAGIPVLAANLTLTGGTTLGEARATFELGPRTIGVVGAVDPARFEGLDEVEVTPALEAILEHTESLRSAGADTVVLLWQGDLAAARTQLGGIVGVDFIAVGADPRDTDELEQIGDAITLEAYDQGRNVGRLKLHCGEGVSPTDGWTNARSGSQDEIERIDRVIESINAQLAAMTYDANNVPPIVQRQLDRMDELRAERAAMASSVPEFPADACRFLFTPVPMEPGLDTDGEINDAMRAYNAALQAINLASAEPPPPAAEGMPHYVGDETCARCHVAEMTMWHDTAHAHAMQTLIDRDKQFDRSCIGCHVTGYERPGGSALGHTDGLVNVQCEQCHGPGSLHARDPSVRGAPLGVVREVPESVCVQCHNEEHSPRFSYDAYRPRILGPGHGLPIAQ